jgi:NADPH-dependent curcumin reductase CurA
MQDGTMRSIVLASRPDGKVLPENFRLVEAAMPVPGPGEFLVRVIWLSLDPYMRGRMNAGPSYAPPIDVDAVMGAECVGEVIASEHPGYDADEAVVGPFGWADHAVSDGTLVRKLDPDAAPVSTALGVLGMPGITAWVALNDIARARSGETIVVSAATGAVGSLLGQLARLKGLRAIGVAGSAEKCAFAVGELGYDACLDHRAGDAASLSAAIAGAAPDGVDIYHENVGGKTLEAVVPCMNTFGRIVVCGMIAWYSGAGMAEAMALPKVWRAILVRRLRVQGMIIFDHFDRYPAFVAEVAPLVADGTIKYRETVAGGLEAAPAAFINLLGGGNFGKQLVRIGPDPE